MSTHAEEWSKSFELCAYCPKMCRFACPVAESTSHETLTPWGKMSAGFFLLHEQLELEEVVEGAYGCTGCAACTRYCTHENDVTGALMALRADAWDADAVPRSLMRVVESFEEHGNAHGRSLASVLDRIVPESLLSEEHDAVYIPGSDALLLGDAGPLPAAVKILELSGVAGVFPHDVSSGLPLYWAGAWDAFDDHAEHIVEMFEEHETLILASAAETWALRELYPERGWELAPRVVHVTEYLAHLFHESVIRLEARWPGDVYYHDPCFLGRRLEIHEAPRRVLDACVQGAVREFQANRQDTVCCGGEGLLDVTTPTAAHQMAVDRLREPREAGVRTVVTSCPRCVRSFQSADAEAIDLLTLVATCL